MRKMSSLNRIEIAVVSATTTVGVYIVVHGLNSGVQWFWNRKRPARVCIGDILWLRAIQRYLGQRPVPLEKRLQRAEDLKKIYEYVDFIKCMDVMHGEPTTGASVEIERKLRGLDETAGTSGSVPEPLEPFKPLGSLKPLGFPTAST